MKVHGTTQAISQDVGLDERDVLNIFARMIEIADVAIAHNIEFDVNIINNAARLMSGDPKLDLFEGKKKFCTMLASVPVCKLPSKFGHPGYAWPKLEEACACCSAASRPTPTKRSATRSTATTSSSTCKT
jgi:DNA polymerase III epsilon subunit-like protein